MPRSHSSCLRAMLSGALLWAFIAAASCPAGAITRKGGQAPYFREKLGSHGVHTMVGALDPRSLERISGGNRKVLLYFWNVRDPKCLGELNALTHFKDQHRNGLQILAIAFPVGGDDKSEASRRKAKDYRSLDIIFDDTRTLYGSYCSANKSETRSAFLIDVNGLIAATRVGDDRKTQEIEDWLNELKIDDGDTSIRTPPDVKGRLLAPEVTKALELGYMSTMDGIYFRPDETMTSGDFNRLLRKIVSRFGLVPPEPPSEPKALATRERVAKMVAVSLLGPDQIDEIVGKLGGPPEDYLSDFVDGKDVTPWAMPYFAVTEYRGLMPPGSRKSSDGPITDWTRIASKSPASREYIAALLVRAFPDPKGYTGLVVHTTPFERTPNLRIVFDSASPEAEVVYPNGGYLPPHSFFQSPGMVSYCNLLTEAKERRAGPRPLELDAVDVRLTPGAPLLIFLSQADAQRLADANDRSLFLRTWRVAIVQDRSPAARGESLKPSADAEGVPNITP